MYVRCKLFWEWDKGPFTEVILGSTPSVDDTITFEYVDFDEQHWVCTGYVKSVYHVAETDEEPPHVELLISTDAGNTEEEDDGDGDGGDEDDDRDDDEDDWSDYHYEPNQSRKDSTLTKAQASIIARCASRESASDKLIGKYSYLSTPHVIQLIKLAKKLGEIGVLLETTFKGSASLLKTERETEKELIRVTGKLIDNSRVRISNLPDHQFN